MENNIEEDIKIALDKFLDNKDIDSAILIVEKFILGNYILRNGRKNIVRDSLRYILSDYKKNIKENEHKTEKIENQKAELAILNEKQKDFNKLQNTLSSYKGQFRRQEKENEKLRKQLNEENKRCMMLAIEKQDYFEKYRYNLQQNESLTKKFSNVIPIQKIKDKIKEIGEKIKYEENEKVVIYLHKQKNILQELIEEREEK